MAAMQNNMRDALVAQTTAQLDALCAKGVRLGGNAYSPIVLIKGELNQEEQAGGELLAGKDGAALRSALVAIGYEPDDFCTLSAADSIDTALFTEVLEVLDPEVVVLLDDTARDVMRESYADALAAIEDFNTAMLMPGLVAHVLGRRVLALDGFEAALSNAQDKQRMWAYLKQIPPLGAPL